MTLCERRNFTRLLVLVNYDYNYKVWKFLILNISKITRKKKTFNALIKIRLKKRKFKKWSKIPFTLSN